ncbi:MAG: hypothetical protein Q9210_004122 [Variospora velana]
MPGRQRANDNPPIPWTEQVAHARAKVPSRRLSANYEPKSNQSPVRRPALIFTGNSPRERPDGHDGYGTRFFGLPSPGTQPARLFGAMDQDTEPFCTSEQDEPALMREPKIADSVFREAPRIMSPQDYPNPFSPERQRKILRFADEEEDLYGKSSAASTSTTTAQQMQHAFAMHALNQGHGVGLRNEFPKEFRRLKIKPPRPRTFILGHKAGLWLTDYSYQSFCDLAKALALHEQQTLGYVYERTRPEEKVYGFYVEIEGEREGKRAINSISKTSTFSERFETAVLPFLNRPDPKPRIRVRAQIDTLREHIDTQCKFDCDCDDSRELELMALDVGRLRLLAEWHRWDEDALLHSNSLIFETTMFDLLYPSPAFADEYEFVMELPDHTTYRLVRGTKPLLGAEAQQALSRFTTIKKEAGVQPRQVQLWPRGESTVETAQASPSQKSPGLARAEGVMFVHRPARFTHFRYDAPHTMERFFTLARSQLYPNTSGKLRLRISPNDAFQKEAKLLVPIESESVYTTSDSDEESLEEWWKREVLDPWLDSEEDIWAIKIFDSIQVFDGTDSSKASEEWDLSELKAPETEADDYPERWSIPPEILRDKLGVISKNLLDIDPNNSPEGIVLHVIHETPTRSKKEWLHCGAEHSFVHFLKEVLFKIDGDTIAIYPGNYEETTDSTIARIADTAANMRKKRIETDALNVIAKGAVQHVSESPKKATSKKKAPKDQRPPRVVFASSSPEIVAIDAARQNAGRNHIEPIAVSPTSHHTELGLLRQRLNRAENEILHREHSCRVCGAVFLSTLPNATDQVRNPSDSRINRTLTDDPDSGALCNARYATWTSLSAQRVPGRSGKPHAIPFIRGKGFPMNGVASWQLTPL